MSLMPRSIGYQDLVALMARGAEASQRARAHMLASPFGTIHAATFSFPQPVGTEIPDPQSYRLASVGTYDPEATGALGQGSMSTPLAQRWPGTSFPSVNRRLKGDLLVTRPHDDELEPGEGTRDLTPGRVKTVSFPKPRNENSIDESDDETRVPVTAAQVASASTEAESNAAVRLGRLYFGNVGDGVGAIQSWPDDEQLVIEQAPSADPDIKRGAAVSIASADFNFETASLSVKASLAPMVPDAPASNMTPLPMPGSVALSGQTIAAKGEVTGAGHRPRTPAERLNLDAKQRAKSEKCMADAVYFEARGEPKRGQIAVAQVVMNRVFSGFYPNSVCGTVYQNASRHNSCQFTFACDDVKDTIDEPDMWEQAKEIARDMLDGKLWLPEIGHSTHYHAFWVHPSWVNEMKKLYKIGVHSFYRPRAWGDAVEVPNHPFVAPNSKS